MMKSARPIVRPMAVSRTFHHGRLSSMSYALFSVLMMAITPAEVLHRVSSMPVVSSPPLPLLAIFAICSRMMFNTSGGAKRLSEPIT